MHNEFEHCCDQSRPINLIRLNRYFVRSWALSSKGAYEAEHRHNPGYFRLTAKCDRCRSRNKTVIEFFTSDGELALIIKCDIELEDGFRGREIVVETSSPGIAL